MKKTVLALVSTLLVSCGSSYTDNTNKYTMPKGWESCQVINLTNGINSITVVRCPNSSTSANYHEGKFTENTTVIEDCNDAGCLDPKDKKIIQKMNIIQAQLDSLKKQME